MAVSRYDQHKNYEEEEANAIGAEYLWLDFLAAADAAKRSRAESRKTWLTRFDLPPVQLQARSC